MRRARPYRGENPEPGKDVTENLTPRPELENGHRCQSLYRSLFQILNLSDSGLHERSER